MHLLTHQKHFVIFFNFLSLWSSSLHPPKAAQPTHLRWMFPPHRHSPPQPLEPLELQPTPTKGCTANPPQVDVSPAEAQGHSPSPPPSPRPPPGPGDPLLSTPRRATLQTAAARGSSCPWYTLSKFRAPGSPAGVDLGFFLSAFRAPGCLNYLQGETGRLCWCLPRPSSHLSA